MTLLVFSNIPPQGKMYETWFLNKDLEMVCWKKIMNLSNEWKPKFLLRILQLGHNL